MKKSTDLEIGKIPDEVRPNVEAAMAAVKRVAPNAEEVVYNMDAPRSKSMMWKIVRYRVDDAYVVGIGTFPKHSTLFFYRGRELDDGSGLLQGSGKDTRFITLHAPRDLDRPEVQGLLKKAFDLGGIR
jgi:hypothetical protein